MRMRALAGSKRPATFKLDDLRVGPSVVRAEPIALQPGEWILKEIPGVGDAIADIIVKLHKTGNHPSLQAMRKEIPSGALDMLGIPGLRPDKVLKIYKELGIYSVDELEKAAKADRLKPVKGLGAAFEDSARHRDQA
jgi:DNA polymerase (family 10)